MTSGRGEEPSPVAGGPARHIPVLLEEAISVLAPHEGGVYLDGTFGAGGYSRAILAHAGARVVALDRDPTAIAAGAAMVEEFSGRLILLSARFGDLDAAVRTAGIEALDGIVLDIGVSSMQLDEAARGFSFRFEGPLDMRMEMTGRSAADIVNEGDEEEIADILYHFGEERLARRFARAIVHDRRIEPFTTTAQLAGLIERLNPPRFGQIHPATRTFQGLRIAVNDELGELARALAGAERMLAPGGTLAVVSFHSLEDRIVKQFFAERSGRGQARSRLLPGEPAQAASTFDCPAPQPVGPLGERNSHEPQVPLGAVALRSSHAGPRARTRRRMVEARRLALEAERARQTEEGPLTWCAGSMSSPSSRCSALRFTRIAPSTRRSSTPSRSPSCATRTSASAIRIAVLQAEWAHLTRPTRIQSLADQHLDLKQLTVDQIVQVTDLPDQPPRQDSIGKKLELLGLGEGTSPSRAARIPAAAATTPGNRTRQER